MSKKFIFLFILIFFDNSFNANSKENLKFFNQGKKHFEKEKYDQAKLYFEKNLVRNPKNFKSYLYLSKIYKIKKIDDEYEKNLNTVLLLEPKNEDALYMLVSKKLTDGDYDLAKKKFEIFKKSCKKLCDKKIELSNLIKKSKN
jgi:tetratricopeptide (TPR) repeat protein